MRVLSLLVVVAFALAKSASAEEAPAAPASVGGGGGLSAAVIAAGYLKLNMSNGPLTGSASGGYLLKVSNTANAPLGFYAENLSAGAAALTYAYFLNDTSNAVVIGITSSGFTTTTYQLPDEGFLQSNGRNFVFYNPVGAARGFIFRANDGTNVFADIMHVFNETGGGSGGVVINEDGSGVPVPLRVEGDTNTDVIHVDGPNNRVGILTAAPATALHVTGGVRVSAGIDAPSATDLTLSGGASSGSVVVKSIDNVTDIQDSAGGVDGEIATTTSAVAVTYCAAGAAGGCFKGISTQAIIGARSNEAAGSLAVVFADSVAIGSHTALGGISGAGVIVPLSQSALAISGTPDTTRAPMTSGSACRFSAGSAGQSWTPAETSALDGAYVCCTNTGANSVTITASAGVFEGGGGAVAQWKTICMDYVTDRWVQRSSISP